MEAKKHTTEKDKNAIEVFMYRYMPYWPLFAILVVFFGLAAFAYLQVANPVYEVSANILVKDEKKGADEAKILEALNITSNKIVENEIEVIQSKELLKEVINNLHLYAPVFEDKPIIPKPAYASSPVAIELQNPNSIKESDRVDFTYNKKNSTITIQGKVYPLNKWVNTSFGIVKFINNPKLKVEATRPLYFSLIDPKEVLTSLVSNLSVSPASKLSSVINLTIKDEVPQRGEDILNSLIQAYYDAATNDKNVLASNTLSFVEGRIKYVAKELDSIENRLQKFRTQKGVVDLSEQGKVYLQGMGDNDRKMTDINMQLAMLNEVEKYVLSKDNQIGIVPSMTGFKDPLFSQLLQGLYEQQMQYERLKKTVPTGNPTMVSLKAEIDSKRPAILENIQNQRLSLQASKNGLSAGTGMYSSILQTIPQKEKELIDISRQQAIKNDAYSFLLQKREETALAYAAMVEDSRTISRAEASFLPVSPKKWFVYLSAFALALILGFAVVNTKEYLTNKVLFRSDIENLTSIPVAAEIIKIKGKSPFVVGSATSNNRRLSCIEQFRQLRAATGLNGRNLKHKKVLITSSIASEGKSFVCNNLALSLAMSGKKVLLVDFDLRNPKTSTMHKLVEKKGVAAFLENNEEPLDALIHHTDFKELYVIPAGSTTANPTELLLNADLGKFFAYLDPLFDFILFDTCPVDPLTDAYILSEYCDVTLFVVRHGFTTKGMVELLEENNKVNALKNVAIVFNGIKSRGFLKKGYGYGYGYGSRKVYGQNVYQIRSMPNKA